MQFFSYIPKITTGPNGTKVRHTADDDGTIVVVGEYNGRTVVIVPDDAVIPEQPAIIDWTEEPITAELQAWYENTNYYSILQTARETKQAARLKALESAREAGFTFAGNIVSSDVKSQLLIMNAVQNAKLAIAEGNQEALDTFSTSLGAGWRGQNGTIVARTAAEIIDMGKALSSHIAQCDLTSQIEKAHINAAETISELNSAI